MGMRVVAAAVLGCCLCAATDQGLSSQARMALTGIVTSDAEGPMEGVLVSARAEGSSIRVTVVSDRDGRFAFPLDRLTPGRHQLTIRATGYDLVDPGAIDLTAAPPRTVNL